MKKTIILQHVTKNAPGYKKAVKTLKKTKNAGAKVHKTNKCCKMISKKPKKT